MDSLIKCSICKEILEEPVVLPCGHTVCKKHVKEDDSSIIIKCLECETVHEKAENRGFPKNIVVEKLLRKSFDKLDLGTEHNDAVKAFREIKQLIDKIKRLREDPEFELDSVISKLKNEIDVRREEAKQSIDNEALRLIKKLDDYERECKVSLKSQDLKQLNDAQNMIDWLEKDLKLWDNQIFTFEKNVDRWKAIHKEETLKIEQLKKEHDRIERILFSDTFLELQKEQEEFCCARIGMPL